MPVYKIYYWGKFQFVPFIWKRIILLFVPSLVTYPWIMKDPTNWFMTNNCQASKNYIPIRKYVALWGIYLLDNLHGTKSSLRSSEVLRLLWNPMVYYNVNKRSGMIHTKVKSNTHPRLRSCQINLIVLRWEGISSLPNPLLEDIPCWLSAVVYSIYLHLPSIFGDRLLHPQIFA
jgi:hypothetical protein